MGVFNRAVQREQEARLLRRKELAIFNAIKEQPDLAPKSKKLATRSIMFSCFGILTLIIALVGAYFIFTMAEPSSIFTIITIAIIGGGLSIYLFFLFFIKALISLIYQFKLNKTAISWIALCFILLPAIVLVFGIITITVVAK